MATELAQQLRAPAVLTEAEHWLYLQRPSTGSQHCHGGSQPSAAPVLKDLIPSGCHRPQTHVWPTDIHAGSTPILIREWKLYQNTHPRTARLIKLASVTYIYTGQNWLTRITCKGWPRMVCGKAPLQTGCPRTLISPHLPLSTKAFTFFCRQNGGAQCQEPLRKGQRAEAVTAAK